MARTFYTLWKGKVDDEDNALFLEEQPIFRTKHRAFKKAKQLAKSLAIGWDLVIFVRRIHTDTDICEQWTFDPVKM